MAGAAVMLLGVAAITGCSVDDPVAQGDGALDDLRGPAAAIGWSLGADAVPVVLGGSGADDRARVVAVDGEAQVRRLPALPDVEWVGASYSIATDRAVFLVVDACGSPAVESDVGFECRGSEGDGPLLLTLDDGVDEWTPVDLDSTSLPVPVSASGDTVTLAFGGRDHGQRRSWKADGTEVGTVGAPDGDACSLAQVPETRIVDGHTALVDAGGPDPREAAVPAPIAPVASTPWGSALCASAGHYLASSGRAAPPPNVDGDPSGAAASSSVPDGNEAGPEPIRVFDLRTGDQVVEVPDVTLSSLLTSGDRLLLATDAGVHILRDGAEEWSGPAEPGILRSVEGGFLRFVFAGERIDRVDVLGT